VARVVIRLARVSFACAEPARVEAFWRELLGEEGALLAFRSASKTPTIEAPLHLDVNTPEPDAEVERALSLGARLVARKHERRGPIDEAWTVLRDPEGNGFCIQGPDTRRGGPYVGNVTFSCARPKVLGRFWRDALGYAETELPAELERAILEAGVDPAEFEAYSDAVPADGSRPRLLFQRREKSPAPEPALRLELAAPDAAAQTDRLVALGAERTGDRLLRDPDGNPFVLEELPPRRQVD
jgi:catechol 2,3-dioxygenase-like lactoylglutathione lyase family enzyme